MINITYNCYPYRLDLKSKEPVEFKILINSLNNSEKLISADIVLDASLCLDKTGLKKAEYKRLGYIKPNEKIELKFDIYPFQSAQPGTYKIKLVVNEHYNDYKYIETKTIKNIELKVI